MKIENPYAGMKKGTWLRGNLHAHTTASDGQQPVQKVIDDYAALGHDFLMISDHDIVTGAKDYAKLDARGLVLIPGNEISNRGPHLLHVNATQFVAPDGDRQKVVDAINAGPGFAVFNHPNWLADFNHCSIENLALWHGYVGIEIFNGVIGRLDGSPLATDKWDKLLSAGRRIWGFANDDSHAAKIDLGLGWNVVATANRSVRGILTALRRGSFYASTGVTITDIAVQGNRILVQTKDADRIVAVRDVGKEFAWTDAKTLTVEVPAGAKYVRFECRGRGGRTAWTQPFFVSGS